MKKLLKVLKLAKLCAKKKDVYERSMNKLVGDLDKRGVDYCQALPSFEEATEFLVRLKNDKELQSAILLVKKAGLRVSLWDDNSVSENHVSISCNSTNKEIINFLTEK